jgi:hypothetical protein
MQSLLRQPPIESAKIKSSPVSCLSNNANDQKAFSFHRSREISAATAPSGISAPPTSESERKSAFNG